VQDKIKRSFSEILFLVVSLAMLVGGMYVLAPAGLYSNEEGVHYVQMKNFALNGSLAITGPAQQLGFKPADAAGWNGLLEVRSDKLYAVTPPLFPWVASLFYPLCGDRAVDFTPILFVFLSALVLGLILDQVMQRGCLYYFLLVAFLLGSPVLLQGWLFLGMAFALFLIVSALWLAASHWGENPSGVKLFGAAFLMGASVLIRPECMFIAFSFYVCAAIVLPAQRRKKDLYAVLAGGVFAVAALVLHDVIVHGRFPGSYLQLVLPLYALSPIRVAVLGGALVASTVLFIVARRDGIGPVRKAILSTLSLIIAFGAVLLTAARFSVSHLMALFPAVLFVFYGIPGWAEGLKEGKGTLESVLAGTVIICLVLGAAILRPGDWIVWLAWLPTVPFVVLFLAIERERIFAQGRGMYVVLAFFSGVAFVNGIQELKDEFLKYKGYNAARIEFLQRSSSAGDAILFGDTTSMEHAGPLFWDRVFLVAESPADRERLAPELAEKGIGRAYAWTDNPLEVTGYNSYREESPPAFPFPPGTKSCCSGSCKHGNFYLVRLDTADGRIAATPGTPQNRSRKENGS
jgi:hypothetical protein